MLRTACIRSPRAEGDGLRISVMSRHTLNDGKTPHPDITLDLYDEHWPQLAPPGRLLGKYYRDGLRWDKFEEIFEKHMADMRHKGWTEDCVESLAHLALEQDVTILCIEPGPEHCHRRLVAARCQLFLPELEVVIN